MKSYNTSPPCWKQIALQAYDYWVSIRLAGRHMLVGDTVLDVVRQWLHWFTVQSYICIFYSQKISAHNSHLVRNQTTLFACYVFDLRSLVNSCRFGCMRHWLSNFRLSEEFCMRTIKRTKCNLVPLFFLFFSVIFWFSTVPVVSCGNLFSKSEVYRAQ